MPALASRQARDGREGRRLRAWELQQQDWPQRRIAEALGVTEGAVSQWPKRARLEGWRGSGPAHGQVRGHG
jgi:transposase